MNHLAGETSPYLRQHRDNPVNWFPWGTDAFEEAAKRDCPVLLSVGYSSCHWCHVMAHESFEDPNTAAVMNDLFVNIKVDREERPDVDAIYMEAVQSLTGHGGWPMTVFLTPEGRPFFGGTYYPKVRRGGMPAFVEVLTALATQWQDNRADVLEQAGRLTASLGQLSNLRSTGQPVGPDWIGQAAAVLVADHDAEFGGFGRPPKFPQAMSIDLLLRHAATSQKADVGAAAARETALNCLDAMAAGGIYDHLGGGFARYSTDTRWLVPHFEKMLYDNALLLRCYVHAWQLTSEPRYRQVVEETVDYALTELALPGGGFASAQDADSEGVEGKFYVWTLAEAAAVGGPAVAAWYGVSEAGNFHELGGPHNILNRLHDRRNLLRPEKVEAGRAALAEARRERVRPGLDDKALTEWNALFLSALAEAAAVFDRTDWMAAAVANGEFLLRELRRPDGRWLRSWQQAGGARHLAYAADYAAVVEAFVRLNEATGETRWLDAAQAAANGLLELFWDDVSGGLFTTGEDAEALITRPKDLMDTAIPAANSSAAVGLTRLAALTGKSRYRNAADAILALTQELARKHPSAFGYLLAALDLATAGTTEIVIVGDRLDLVAEARRRYLPRAVVAWGQVGTGPLWAGRADGLAYVCRNYTCQLPAQTTSALADQLL